MENIFTYIYNFFEEFFSIIHPDIYEEMKEIKETN
jgi:hypothetical protein